MFNQFLRHRANKTVPPKVLKERFMIEARALKFERHHFLFETFDRKLQQYIEADLVAYSNRVLKEANNPKRYEKLRDSFAVLTFDELEAGFVVFLVPLVSSIFLFGYEWILTLKDALVFIIAFQKYIELKKKRCLPNI